MNGTRHLLNMTDGHALSQHIADIVNQSAHATHHVTDKTDQSTHAAQHVQDKTDQSAKMIRVYNDVNLKT